MYFQNDDGDERLDRATARRLSQLRNMPVDTTRLEQRIRSQVARPRRRPQTWFRPMRAVAAGFVLLLLGAAVFLTTSGGPALASPAQMAQMHQDLVAGRMPAVRVDSIEAANKVLAEKSPGGPELPDIPAEHVMACCMKSVKDKRVACVLLKSEGVPVTMVVANAADMRSPKSREVLRGGVAYRVDSVGALSMVMTERHERWVCLIGEMPAERLMDLAAKLEF